MLPRPIPFRARAPWYGGTLQTLRALRWPFAPGLPKGERLWLTLADGDALAAMLHRPRQSRAPVPRPLVVLVHGLAGTEADPYVREAAAGMLRRGFPVLRLNLRGSMLSAERSTSHYHLGRSEDLAQALAAVPAVLTGNGVLVAGWSLGGALGILLLARDAAQNEGRGAGDSAGTADAAAGPDTRAAAPVRPPMPRLLGGAAISAPIQPELAHEAIDAHPVLGRTVLAAYRREILSVEHARDLPEPLREKARAAPTLKALEAEVTAPRFGYPSYDAFVEVNRPAAVLPGLRLPLMLLTAADDPLVPVESWDGVPWAQCPAVLPLRVEGGGHCGFYDAGRGESLSVRAIGAFFTGLADQAAKGASAEAAMDQGDASSASSMAQHAATRDAA